MSMFRTPKTPLDWFLRRYARVSPGRVRGRLTACFRPKAWQLEIRAAGKGCRKKEIPNRKLATGSFFTLPVYHNHGIKKSSYHGEGLQCDEF